MRTMYKYTTDTSMYLHILFSKMCSLFMYMAHQQSTGYIKVYV